MTHLVVAVVEAFTAHHVALVVPHSKRKTAKIVATWFEVTATGLQGSALYTFSAALAQIAQCRISISAHCGSGVLCQFYLHMEARLPRLKSCPSASGASQKPACRQV